MSNGVVIEEVPFSAILTLHLSDGETLTSTISLIHWILENGNGIAGISVEFWFKQTNVLIIMTTLWSFDFGRLMRTKLANRSYYRSGVLVLCARSARGHGLCKHPLVPRGLDKAACQVFLLTWSGRPGVGKFLLRSSWGRGKCRVGSSLIPETSSAELDSTWDWLTHFPSPVRISWILFGLICNDRESLLNMPELLPPTNIPKFWED